MSDLLSYLSENAVAIAAVIAAVHALAVVIVNLTPTPKDNNIVGQVYKVIEALAGVVGINVKTLPGEPPEDVKAEKERLANLA